MNKSALVKMAELALTNVEDGQIIGLGSGSTVAEFVAALGRSRSKFPNVSAIVSSLQIRLVVEKAGLTIVGDEDIPNIQLAVDGADQIDGQFNLIKGGGGALLKERVLLEAAKKRIILADESKYSRMLGEGVLVPIEVYPFARKIVFERLSKIGWKPRVRVNDKGYPHITENGNLILDTDFGRIAKPKALQSKVRSIPGVAEVGIFTMKIDVFYKALRDGTVQRLVP